MAGFLSRTLIRTTLSSSHSTFKLGITQPNRFSSRSGKAQLIEVDLQSEGDVDVLELRNLDDVIHNIIVRQSAPDWLPFVPGSSYWVPPRRRRPESHGFAEVLQQHTYRPESRASWLAESAHFTQGTSPVCPVEVKIEDNQESVSESEDKKE